MIGQSLVFVYAAVALVAGSCLDGSQVQGISQQVMTAPVFGSNVLSTGNTGNYYYSSCGFGSSAVSGSALSSGFGSPAVSGSALSSGFGSPVVFGAALSSGFGSPAVSGAALSSGYSTGSLAGASVPVTDGPSGTPITVVQAPAVTLPVADSPVVTLSSQPIPAPRVLAHRCLCTKTIVKPQIIQRQVTVPRVQRYLKRTVTPVVENVSYKSTPITQGSSSSGNIVISAATLGSSSSSSSSPIVGSFGSASSGSAVVIPATSSRGYVSVSSSPLAGSSVSGACGSAPVYSAMASNSIC